MGYSPSELVKICMECKRAATYGTEDYHEPTLEDLKKYPSHGYCAECFERLYPEDAK